MAYAPRPNACFKHPLPVPQKSPNRNPIHVAEIPNPFLRVSPSLSGYLRHASQRLAHHPDTAPHVTSNQAFPPLHPPTNPRPAPTANRPRRALPQRASSCTPLMPQPRSSGTAGIRFQAKTRDTDIVARCQAVACLDNATRALQCAGWASY
ncbi:hypothetical protein BU26DRAFT_503035 [Trematosphaeria pertusa]|uniref:Uncharacterized protein n=1 Tax=Trematosphaeria pertusa TaxID=390896 RepID=A0A6A6IR70_9PLEO|nr:uncharacterized protein BU26DRAFT_503035 [Trematosphaeria pertusa]KAF2252578.1 hypothetical protein BU26DRAFT_503035 [Trematosphaeria pertusa]